MESTVTGRGNISQFNGLDVRNTATGNDFMDMNNVDSHNFPYLNTRRKNYLFPEGGLKEDLPMSRSQVVGILAYDTDIYIVKRYGVSGYYDYIILEKIDKEGNRTTCIDSEDFYTKSIIAEDYPVRRDFTNVKRKMVIMGANIIIYPDWIQYNVKDDKSISLKKSFSMINTGTIKIAMVNEEGQPYAPFSEGYPALNNEDEHSELCVVTPGSTDGASENFTRQHAKNNGLYYLDGENVSQYYSTNSMWMNTDYYIGIGISLSDLGGITKEDMDKLGLETNKDLDYTFNISGIDDENFNDLNGDYIIHRINVVFEKYNTTEYLVFIIKGINKWSKLYTTAQHYSMTDYVIQSKGLLADQRITIKTKLYDNLDFIISEGNRLFACSSENHEIYASKLGDAGIWEQFQGISTDSYAATVGSPGDFTGAAVFNNVPMFFKENCIHKINGSTPSSFNISYDYYDGIKKGCEKSIVRVGNYIIFYSKEGFVFYTGNQPEKIDKNLGDLVFKDVIAGAKEGHYIAQVTDVITEENYILDFDTELGYWYKYKIGDEGLYFNDMVNVSNDLYLSYLEKYENIQDNLYLLGYGRHLNSPTDIIEEYNLNFYVESGAIGKESMLHKYISRLLFKFKLDFGASILIYLKYDFDDEWELVYQNSNTEEKAVITKVPIKPKRHESLRYKIEGTGNVTVYGIEYDLSEGSEIR